MTFNLERTFKHNLLQGKSRALRLLVLLHRSSVLMKVSGKTLQLRSPWKNIDQRRQTEQRQRQIRLDGCYDEYDWAVISRKTIYKRVWIEEIHVQSTMISAYQGPRKMTWINTSQNILVTFREESLTAREAHQMSLQIKNQTPKMFWLMEKRAVRQMKMAS